MPLNPETIAAAPSANPAAELLDATSLQREPDAMVRGLRAAALAGLLALIALCLAWELWLAPTGRGSLAIKALPLVFCVAGLLRHRMYTFRWLSLLLWLYFMEGVVRATTESGVGQILALAEVVLSTALFACSAAYIRWRLRHPLPPVAEAAPAGSAAAPGTL